MTNDERNPKPECPNALSCAISGFVIRIWSFLRISSFVIRHSGLDKSPESGSIMRIWCASKSEIKNMAISAKARLVTLSWAIFVAPALSGWAGDWPQWRGPDRADVSTETGLLKEWPAEGP